MMKLALLILTGLFVAIDHGNGYPLLNMFFS